MRRIDPMVRLLLLAIVLATVLPVGGRWAGFAQFVSNAAVFLLFFLNGLRLPRREVIAGIGKWRLLVPLTAFVYIAMPAAGWLLWQSTGQVLPPLLALGFLFLGTLPSTVQSATAYTSLAGGNVASSVVAAALLNILGVFVTAPLFALLAGSSAAPFDGAGLLKVMTILLLPFALGQALQRRLGGWVTGHRQLVVWMDRTSIAIAVYVAFSSAVRQGIWARIEPAGWAGILGGCAALLVFGYGGSWLVSRLIGLDRGDRIAMMFAGAQKSIAMGAPLATVLFPPAAAGVILLPTLAYHLAQLVVAAPLASRLKANVPT
ncbi:MAG: bile acid:sodium symporter family protein [Novosphingobium sp.]|nr:bile acid:sodium symporter family protein [Novosphingobium sp.]